MFCKFCGAQIDDDSVFCNKCGKEQKDEQTLQIEQISLDSKRKSANQTKVFVLILIVGIVVVSLAFIYPPSESNNNSSEYTKSSTITIDTALITYDEYLQIKSNMTYDDACKIIGSYGEEMSRAEYGGYQTVVVTWEGYGTIGANAVITFQNGKVSAKSQIGLE